MSRKPKVDIISTPHRTFENRLNMNFSVDYSWYTFVYHDIPEWYYMKYN